MKITLLLALAISSTAVAEETAQVSPFTVDLGIQTGGLLMNPVVKDIHAKDVPTDSKFSSVSGGFLGLKLRDLYRIEIGAQFGTVSYDLTSQGTVFTHTEKLTLVNASFQYLFAKVFAVSLGGTWGWSSDPTNTPNNGALLELNRLDDEYFFLHAGLRGNLPITKNLALFADARAMVAQDTHPSLTASFTFRSYVFSGGVIFAFDFAESNPTP